MRNFITGCFLIALTVQAIPALAQADISFDTSNLERCIVHSVTRWEIISA